MKKSRHIKTILAGALALLLTTGTFAVAPQHVLAASPKRNQQVKRVDVYNWNAKTKKWKKDAAIMEGFDYASFTYDKHGNIKTMKQHYHGNSTYRIKCSYKYGKNRKKRKTVIIWNENDKTTYKNQYNNKGLRIKSTVTGARYQEKAKTTLRYLYDNGYVSQVTGKGWYDDIYRYTTQNKGLLKSAAYDGDTMHTTYSFNNRGMVIRESYYSDEFNDTRGIWTYKYHYNKNGTVKDVVIGTGKYKSKYVFKYYNKKIADEKYAAMINWCLIGDWYEPVTDPFLMVLM